jgi:integrase
LTLFLLKSEGLPYEFLRLPSIKHEKKLPVVLSKEEVWAMLQNAKLLKHRILIGLFYGCGLAVVSSKCTARLGSIENNSKSFRQSKDRYVPLSEHLIQTQKIHRSRKPQDYLLTDNLPTGAGGDFDNRYSQRGAMVKQVQKQQE